MRALISGAVFAIALCAMNSYLTLSFGVIEEGPTIAALFFFAFFFWMANKITSSEMVIVSTMGSAGGSLGFIANFYAAKAMTGTPYTIAEMSIFGIASGLVGIVMVIPLRYLLVVKEELPWPGSKATAGVIRALVEHGDPRQPKILLVTFLLMVTIVIGNDEQGAKWWPEAIAIPGLTAYGASIVWSSPFSVGGSYLMGMRTCVGFLFGAIVLMGMSHFHAVPPADLKAPHHYYWPGLGFLVASGLTTIGVNWRSITGAFTSLASIGDKIGEAKATNEDNDPILSGRNLILFASIAFVTAALVLKIVFHISFLLILLLIAVGGLVQNLIATRAQAQTAFNPARVMGILLQGVCALFGGSAAAINLTGAGFVAGSGAQASVLTGDLAYGRWFRVPSRHQFWTQLLTIVPCSFVSAWVFTQINTVAADGTPALSLDGGRHAAPVAKMWAASALMFERGTSELPHNALLALGVGAAFGVVYTLVDMKKGLHRWLPDPIGVGLGLVLSVSTGLTFFVGGFIMWIVLARWLKVKDVTLTTIAVGCIVAEGIGGVIKPLLAKLGWIAG